MKMWSLFTQPHNVLSLCDFLSTIEHKSRHSEECLKSKTAPDPADFHCLKIIVSQVFIVSHRKQKAIVV